MSFENRPRLLHLGALAVGAMALGACVENPVVDVTEDRPVLRMTLGPGDVVLPGGNVGLSEITITGFDTDVTDAFARATEPAEEYVDVDNPFGAAPAYVIAPSVPGSNTDTRTPVPTEEDVAVNFWGLFNPGFTGVGPGAFDLFGELSGLKPNTTYSVVMGRYALEPAGDLDQHEILTGRAVTEGDALVPLGGTPTGYPDVTCDFSAVSPVTASTNPVMLGTVTTDEEGVVTVDCIVGATGDSPWWRDDSTQSPAAATMPDSMPFGANQPGATLAPGQFNYISLYEGVGTDTDPTPTDQPAVRVQVGPDIDSDGNVINNALKPFPTEVVGGALSELPGGAEAFSVPGRVQLDVTGLPSLEGRTYQVWLYDRESGSYAPAEGSEFTITQGETSETSTGTTFDSPGEDATISVDVAAGADLDFGTFSHVVFSHEGGAASSPSETKFLFHEYLTAAKALQDGAMDFGSFGGAGNAREFSVSGSGTGEFFRDSLFVSLLRLPQPAQGFHYQSYLVRLVGPEAQAQQRLHTVQLDALGNGQDRIGENEVGSFADYNTYLLVLEPDGSTELTQMRIQASDDYATKFGSFFGGGG